MLVEKHRSLPCSETRYVNVLLTSLANAWGYQKISIALILQQNDIQRMRELCHDLPIRFPIATPFRSIFGSDARLLRPLVAET